MDNMYYFEVPYTCTCEKCGKSFGGIIKRGPLQIGSNVLSTGLQAGVNSAEMRLSKRLIEGDIENRTAKYFTADNKATCPDCNARQSWLPINQPKKPSHVGSYIAALIFFPLIAMAIWGICFFDDVVPFIILNAIAVFLGIFLPYRSHKKHKEEEMKEYETSNKEYLDYVENIKGIEKRNKPEIDWNQAKHIPIK